MSERTGDKSDPVIRRSAAILDGRAAVSPLPPFTSSITAERTSFESGAAQDELRHRLSLSAFRSGLSHTLRYQSLRGRNPDGDTVSGEFLISRFLGNSSLRAGANYTAAPAAALDMLLASADTALSSSSSLRLGAAHAITNGSTEYSAGLSREFAKYLAGVNASFDDETGDARVGVSLSFALGKHPGTNDWLMSPQQYAGGGAALARAFVDEDGDGVYSESDTTLSGIRFTSGGAAEREQTDGEGALWITQLPPDQRTAIALEEGSISDPYLIPARAGTLVTSRPGVPARLDFPLLRTGEIEGVTYLEKDGMEKDGGKKESANVQMELVDMAGAVAKTARSGFDGYYLLDRVPPGRYLLRVAPEQAERLGLIAPEPVAVEISAGAGGLTRDIVLKAGRAEPEDSPPME